MSERLTIAQGLDLAKGSPDKATVISSNNLEICAQVMSNKTLLKAMESFDIHLVDGRWFQILYWRWSKRWRPKCSGSDVYTELVSIARESRRSVLIFGGSQFSNEHAVKNLRSEFGVDAVGYSPALGTSLLGLFRSLKKCVNENNVGVCLVCLGAPKQEYLSYLAKRYIGQNVVYLCAGGTVDFISGEISRAPKWMQNMGLEWLYRVLLQPRERVPRVFKAFIFIIRNSKSFPRYYE